MTAAVALLDANVLYPAPVRDLLLQLAFDGLFQARWSAEIEGEWRRNLLRNRPDLNPAQVAATQAMMRSAILDCLVTDYAEDIPGLTLPDPDDRHVVAAALGGAADVIVTFNLKDFPPGALATVGLEVWHPDAFLQMLIEARPLAVLASVRECFSRLMRPPVSGARYLKSMQQHGLTKTAAFLREHISLWQVPRG